MRNCYVFDSKKINEGKLRNEGLERLRKDPNDKTTIHLHGEGQRCNGGCYLVREAPSNSEKRRS
jgi:hypothetical protein